MKKRLSGKLLLLFIGVAAILSCCSTTAPRHQQETYEVIPRRIVRANNVDNYVDNVDNFADIADKHTEEEREILSLLSIKNQEV